MKRWGRVVLVLGALALAGTAGCKKEPDAAAIHRQAGDGFLGKNQFKQAAEEYTKSLEADPKQEKVWEKKAFAHMNADELEQAEAALLKTLEFKTDPAKKAEVYRNVAGMYLQKNAGDKAEKWFAEAAAADPKDDSSLAWLAEIYAQRGGAKDMKADAVPEHLDKALAYYDKVIAVKPEIPLTYLNKRIVLAKYQDHYRKLKVLADDAVKTAQDNKDEVKAAEAKAASDQHQVKMDEFKKQIDEATKKFSEAQKNAKQ